MRRVPSHLLTSCCTRLCGGALAWLVIAALTVQMLVPAGLSARDWVDGQQQSEQESDPAEPSEDDELPQFVGLSPSQLRRSEPQPVKPYVSVKAPISPRSIDRLIVPTERAGRNGIGGPLRC